MTTKLALLTVGVIVDDDLNEQRHQKVISP